MNSFNIVRNWKNVLLLIAFSLLWLGGITQSASAQTAVVNFDTINVRSGPGPSYDIIGNLDNNTSVNILDHSKGWIKMSSGNLTGWIDETLTDQCPTTALPPAIQLSINDKRAYDIDPITINGSTLVPMGAFLDDIGASATYDISSQSVTIRKSGTTVILTIGALSASVNDQVKSLNVPAQIVNGRTFVPLRFLTDALGLKTTWDGENRKINVACQTDTAKNITTNTIVTISANDVNIRIGPSTTSDVLGLAPNGAKLAYVGNKDGWCQVIYYGQTAWVAGWLVTGPDSGAPDLEEFTALPVPSTHQAFVQQMKPYAETVNKATSLPVNFLLAQWAEESGYGTSSLAQYYNNFGGIKDPNTGGFKRYGSLDEFALDVINLYTQHSNYQRLLADARAGASIQTLLNDLTACHYATSSTYGQKIRNSYLPEIDAALANIQ